MLLNVCEVTITGKSPELVEHSAVGWIRVFVLGLVHIKITV
jgi:hypothetical protein